VAVDVAIICATHRNLRDMIAAQQFREDLYYRLNGLAVRLPSLRERTDLMALVQRILDRQSPGRRLTLAPEVLRLCQAYQWPGNVRQLFNVLRTAAVMAAGESVITLDHLSDDFIEDARQTLNQADTRQPVAAPAPAAHAVASEAAPIPAPQPVYAEPAAAPPQSLQDMEIDAIRRAVDAAGGNISEASKRLGISRNTIYRKLRWQAPG
jgi:transcriptional regulator of acetoin/glycerol metabolism